MNKKHNEMVYAIQEYLAAGRSHSTLVGKIINLGEGPEKDRQSARELAQYFVELLIAAEYFKKNNVNTKGSHTNG